MTSDQVDEHTNQQGFVVELYAEESDELITTVTFSEQQGRRIVDAARSANISVEEFMLNAIKRGLDDVDAPESDNEEA